MNKKFKQLMTVRGMGAALTAFVGLIIIYVAFGLIQPQVFSVRNILNLLRSMSKYLLIGVGQSYLLITGNIDLSIGSVVAMSAMISATMMSSGVIVPIAILVALICCLAVGAVNGVLVGKFRLPPSSLRWVPCLWAAASPTWSTETATPMPSLPASARKRRTASRTSSTTAAPPACTTRSGSP